MDGPAVDWTVLADFDGTIVEQQVAELLDEHFGVADPRPIDESYRRGAIGIVEYAARRFGCLRATRDDVLAAALAETTMRPGVGDVVRFCHARGVRLRVISSGLDTYLVPLLAPVGVHEDEITCSRAAFEGDRIVVAAPPDADGLDFKAAAVRAERAAGRRVLYVGDGSNDRAAAGLATFVLARRRLLEHCRANELPHAPFEDFRDVLAWLERNLT